jgi:SAM-dependent methyltransferase
MQNVRRIEAGPPPPVAFAYDGLAPGYDKMFDNAVGRAEDRLLARHLRRFLRGVGPGTVLDVGCGTGNFLRLTDWPVEDYTGLDVSAGMLDVARRNFPRADFRQGDVCEPLPEDLPRLAAVVSLYCALSYVTAPVTALSNLRRVLPRGGRVLLMVNAPRWYAGHVRQEGAVHLNTAPAAWCPWQARGRLTLAGFQVTRVSAFSLLPWPLMAAEPLVARVLPGLGRYLIVEGARA